MPRPNRRDAVAAVSQRVDAMTQRVDAVSVRLDAAIDRHDAAGVDPYRVPDQKPLWRGRLHAWAFFASLPLGVVLVGLVAHTSPYRVVAVVYALSLTGLYAASAAHHRYLGTPRGRAWMRWLDHSMIYVLIAGTFTPIGYVTLRSNWRWSILATMWGAAIIGVAIKLTRLRRFRRMGGALYLMMGWAAFFGVPQFAHFLSISALILMAGGGLLYTSGAVILVRRSPDPNPGVFGYHEVWHACVVGASICHYAMVALALGRT